MPSNNRKVSRRETGLSIAIVFLLVLIAAGVYQAQWDTNPAVTAFGTGPTTTDATTAVISPLAELPEGVEIMTPPEAFSRQNLSDKINGRADLYLSAGFESLNTQRFQLTMDQSAWFELFVYQMGRQDQAFSVFSAQRRSDGIDLKLTKHAYRTANAIFLAHGKVYLELVAAASSERLLTAMQALAQRFVEALPAAATPKSDADLFPKADLIGGSISLIAENAFGFDRFNQFYTAAYQLEGAETVAFLSRRPSAEAAVQLKDQYLAFLDMFGATAIETAAPVAGMTVMAIMDAHIIVFNRGPYIAGVHMAESLTAGLELTARLDQALR